MLTARNILLCIIGIAPVTAFSATPCPPQVDVEAAQDAAVAQHKADVNTSAKSAIDSIISSPLSAKDAGCLDGILGLDLSFFAVDALDLWGPLYDQFKNQLLSQACSAATDYVNSQTAQLTASLSGPLGGVTITQGSSISDWQSVVRADVTLSNTELNNRITTGVLGDVPAIPANNQAPTVINSGDLSEVVDRISPAGDVKTGLDIMSLWGN